jgi:hypothetical protein
LEAIEVLWRVLGDSINLPFNAYDHVNKLSFDFGQRLGIPQFAFDLRGTFTRRDSDCFGGSEAAEVFVEVKKYASGNALLGAFGDFLQRAAAVSSLSEHTDTWFLFVTSVPFGTTKGVDLCDGTYLRECSERWPDELRSAWPQDLHNRIAVVIATASFVRVVRRWGRDE